MRNFNRDNRSDRDRDSRKPFMHQAICAECGRSCEVPFRPSGDKPIYCSSCFENKGGGDRRSGRRDSGRRDFGGRDSRKTFMHQATCDECGRSCEVPFQPSSGKPVYCDHCFKDRRDKKDKGDNKQSDKQFDTLNRKLDQILKALAPSVSTEIIPKKKTAEKDKTPKSQKTDRKKVVKKKVVAKKAPAKKAKKKK